MISQTEALERIKELATEHAETFQEMGHLNVVADWQAVLELIDEAEPREWPSLLDVPEDVKRVFDKDDDVWVRTATSWEMGSACENNEACRTGHRIFGPYTPERKH
ncbi:hypothetical protein E3_0330 [Rhodococcus phage E3]|uniref:hypothetical protein n=1 Tax=Rhodococcus phage E3 TaxID=1007869 RepID=UPI0002C6D67B|nr:hypothetical protein M176_gp034 [Rhodococcus phage E3]AEQ20944.1 hypothetical protein E3_0330 [Rhodococcus phage E3]